MQIGFTTMVALTYLALLIADAAALMHGVRTKKWMAFSLITALMVIGLAVLVYLWIIWPM